MRYPILLSADLHLTANPRDEYRWGLFPWMREQCKKHGVHTVCLLGDLTDAKDFHPSPLVNRVAREIRELAQLARVYMIPGNHEWLKQGEEFWRFLSMVSDRVHYFTQPCDDPFPHKDGPVVRFLPFTKTPAKDWASARTLEDYDLVFMHQTVRGARSSNGEEMEGEDVPVALLQTAGYVFSGDIHVPQQIPGTKNMEYVGSPYHVHFGDAFRPRCVLLPSRHRGTWLDLHYPTISRVTIDVTDLEAVSQHAEDLRAGDQVKLRMHLQESEKHEWKAMRREALAILAHAKVEVHGLELVVEKSGRRRLQGEDATGGAPRRLPADDLLRFVVAEELGAEAFDVGMEVIE